jgi:hypothetical protein
MEAHVRTPRETTKRLAANARRSASSEAVLLWSVSSSFLFAASFPLSWEFNFVWLPVGAALLGSTVISGAVALLWFYHARRVITRAEKEYHDLISEMAASQRETHLQTLRARQVEN